MKYMYIEGLSWNIMHRAEKCREGKATALRL